MMLYYGKCIFVNAYGNGDNPEGQDDAFITMKLTNKKKIKFKASFYCEFAWNDLEKAGLVLFEVDDNDYMVDFIRMV